MALCFAQTSCSERSASFGRSAPENWDHPFVVGAFDPSLALVGHDAVDTEHLFLAVTNVRAGTSPFFADLAGIEGRGHGALVTVEPWPIVDEDVLEATIAGAYDAEYRRIFTALARHTGATFMRWAHEPEIPVDRYPWQLRDPARYIVAFRHVAQLCRRVSPGTHVVWGPTGDHGAMDYWPGREHVDVVGLAIYALPDKDITDVMAQETFGDILDRKLGRVRRTGLPVLVAEFGVMGDEDFQRSWILDAARVLDDRARVVGVSYFNRVDVDGVWGDIPPPRWDVEPATFDAFVKALDRALTR